MALFALVATMAPGISAQAPVERVWYDGNRPRQIWMAPDEVAVVFEARALPRSAAEAERYARQVEPEATLQKQTGQVALYKIRDGHTPPEHVRMFRGVTGVRHASPVFYEGVADPNRALALSGEIIVGFRRDTSPQEIAAFAAEHRLTLIKALEVPPHTYLFDARATTDSLAVANAIYLSGQVAFASPNWIKSAVPR